MRYPEVCISVVYEIKYLPQTATVVDMISDIGLLEEKTYPDNQVIDVSSVSSKDELSP